MVALLVFIMATLEKKKLLDTKGPFDGKFSKIWLDIQCILPRIMLISYRFIMVT